jgi:hypothetical protein
MPANDPDLPTVSDKVCSILSSMHQAVGVSQLIEVIWLSRWM